MGRWLLLFGLGAFACDRLVPNLAGPIGPEAGIVRGKLPVGSRAVTQVKRLTDGIAAKAGDPGRTDLTSALTSADAFVTWDLGAETAVRCALVDADGDDRYHLTLSSDGATFTPLWTAEPDPDRGQQLRAGRDLKGTGRYLRLSATGGDGRWSVSELSAWSACPTTWPPLAMQAGTPDDEALRFKIQAFLVLAVASVLLYRKRLPDWAKLLVALPAGLAIAIGVQLAQMGPPSPEIARWLVVAAGAIVVTIALRLAIARIRAAA
jgi:hypothetical protein